MKILTEDQLKRYAPSIFSGESHEKMSEKYALIPTIECVKGLEKSGFYPVNAQESRCRSVENRPYSKHLIRFRHESTLEKLGNIPEIVLVNSHNGACSYQLRAGIYRTVCANGLIVGNEVFCHKIRHQGDVVSKVVGAAQEIIDVIPEVLDVSGKWQSIKLSNEQSALFAQSSALLKWKPEDMEFDATRLLTVRRSVDNSNDLWSTFNRIQENLIKGGVRYYNKKTDRRASTREVTSVSENSRLNTALWNLTEKMGELLS